MMIPFLFQRIFGTQYIVKTEHRAAIYKVFKDYVDEEGLFFYAYDINYNHSLSRFFPHKIIEKTVSKDI